MGRSKKQQKKCQVARMPAGSPSSPRALPLAGGVARMPVGAPSSPRALVPTPNPVLTDVAEELPAFTCFESGSLLSNSKEVPASLNDCSLEKESKLDNTFVACTTPSIELLAEKRKSATLAQQLSQSEDGLKAEKEMFGKYFNQKDHQLENASAAVNRLRTELLGEQRRAATLSHQLSQSNAGLVAEKEIAASLEKTFIGNANKLDKSIAENDVLLSQIKEEKQRSAVLAEKLLHSDAKLQASRDKAIFHGKMFKESQSNASLLASEVDIEKRKSEKCDAQMDKLNEIAKGSVAQWRWSGPDDQWYAFDMAANPELECAYQGNGGHGTCQLQSGMYSYTINFEEMTQINSETGKTRSIQRQVFGLNNSDPLTVVQLVLAARSQEAEALGVHLARAQKELEAKVMMGASLQIRNDELELERGALEDANVRLQNEKQDFEAAWRQSQSNLGVVKSDMQKLQDKDRGTEQHIIDMERAQQEGRVALQRTQGELNEAKQKNHDVTLSHHGLEIRLAQVVRERDAIRTKSATDVNSTGTMVRSFTEFWKRSPQDAKKFEESSCVMEKVTRLFKGLSHNTPSFNGVPSRCHAFQQMKVLSVHSLHNPHLWSKYTRCKEELQQNHRKADVKVRPLAIHDLDSLIEGLQLDTSLNEVLLAHGCDANAANGILQDGFDIRYTNTHGGSLYGEGIYFSTQLCKCHQYTDTQGPSRLRHIILARVVMGDPCLLKGQHTGRFPPYRDPSDQRKGRYDSNAVDPAASTRGQAHPEYVVFDGSQAYAEMLVTYEVP